MTLLCAAAHTITRVYCQHTVGMLCHLSCIVACTFLFPGSWQCSNETELYGCQWAESKRTHQFSSKTRLLARKELAVEVVMFAHQGYSVCPSRVYRLPIEGVLFAHRGCSVCPPRLFRLPTENGHSTGSAAGATATTADKTWNVLNGLGSMAFAYSFSFVLVEIQVSVHLSSWRHASS